MIFVLVFSISLLFSPIIAGGDFPPSAPAEPGDESKYAQISAADEGFDTWQPVKDHNGYRYGPSKILNADGSLDVRSAANGPGNITDMVTYKRFSDESRVAVWEFLDRMTFRHSGYVAANTCKKLRNCGISGRADGHIGEGGPVYLSYAYAGADDTGSWGNWATGIHKVTLSLADAPMEDAAAVTCSAVITDIGTASKIVLCGVEDAAFHPNITINNPRSDFFDLFPPKVSFFSQRLEL